jgi:tetratricopeptide (TPR) repeat protein
LKKSYPGTVSPAIERSIIKRWSLQSLEKLSKQIATDPENPELYVARAKLYMNTGQADKAFPDFQKACSLDPQNAFYRKCLDELNKQH